MGRPVSIQDIARAAGVSHSTVSRALRDSSLISAEVRSRIQQLAVEMGYTPNAIAQSLQTNRTHSIGLVVSTIGDPFWADVVRGVEQVAQTAGLSVLLSAAHRDPDLEIQVIENFHRRRVDGILVADSRMNDAAAARLARTHIPTVVLNSQAESALGLLANVSIDDQAGARMAVEHLLGLGHRAIGYIGLGNRPRSNTFRLAGYREALTAANIPLRKQWEVIAPDEDELIEDDVAAGEALTYPLINSGVSAICCYNDMVAIGVLLACRSLRINIPRQLSVIGFDDLPTVQYVTPPLTTIRQPRVELGQYAMQTLVNLIEGQQGGSETASQTILPSLVIRESCAPPLHRELR
jgi:LacI family transcriptional regulator/LacI family repressor for deo operon, udp, cdd, tsx, nupC, and nupG